MDLGILQQDISRPKKIKKIKKSVNIIERLDSLSSLTTFFAKEPTLMGLHEIMQSTSVGWPAAPRRD